MLKINGTLKKIFFLTLISMCIILVLTMVIKVISYYLTVTEMKEDFYLKSKETISQVSSEIQRYFLGKYYIHAEELALITNVYLNLAKSFDTPNYMKIDSKCLANAYDNYDPNNFVGFWAYKGNKNETNLSEIDKNNLKILCQMNDLFSNLMLEKRSFSGFNESSLSYSILFNSSLYYEFPFNKKDSNPSSNSLDYQIKGADGIIYTDYASKYPYNMMIGSQQKIRIFSYLNHDVLKTYKVCIKTTHKTIFCVKFSLEDFSIKKKLKTNSKLDVVEVSENNTNLIVYTNNVETENERIKFKIFHQFLMKLKNELFLKYNSKVIKEAWLDINITNVNFTRFNNILLDLKTNDFQTSDLNSDEYLFYNLLNKIIEMSNYYNKNIIFSNLNRSALYEHKTLENSYYYSKTNKIIESRAQKSVFLFSPFPIGFEYNELTGTLNLRDEKNFWMVTPLTFNADDISTEIYMDYIIPELVDTFIFCIALDALIWALLGSTFYFFLKTILAPLHIVNNQMKSLLLKKPVNEEKGDVENFDKKDVMNLTFEIGNLMKKFKNDANHAFKKYENKLIDFEEISNAYIALSLLKVIKAYKFHVLKKIQKNDKSNLNDIIEIFFFLMYCIKDEIAEDQNFDIVLISNLIYNNFVFKIFNFSEENDVEYFFHFFMNLTDRAIQNTDKSMESGRKIKDLHNSPQLDSEKIILNSNSTRKIFEKLKEDIQYRYCLYKFKNFHKSLESESLESKRETMKKLTILKESNLNIFDMNQKNITIRSNRYSSDELRKYGSSMTFESRREPGIIDKGRYIKELIKSLINFEKKDTNVENIKPIAIHLMLAQLFLEINKIEECNKQCFIAMELIRDYHNKIAKNSLLTKFTFLLVSSLFYEKIFMLLAYISGYYSQKKTQSFFFLKILDISPLKHSNSHLIIYENFYDIAQKAILEIKNQDPEYKKSQHYFDLKLLKNKVRALQNMSRNIQKNLVYLYDRKSLQIDDQNLHYIFSKFKKQDNLSVNTVLFSDKTYFCPKEYEQNHISFLIKLRETISHDNVSDLDLAIGDCLDKFTFEDYPKNNNFLYVFTTIDAKIDFSQNKIDELLSKSLKGNFSIIVFLLWDTKMVESESLKSKAIEIKKWVESISTNSQFIIIDNFDSLRKLINISNPVSFACSSPLLFKNMIESIDNNLRLNLSVNMNKE